MKPLIYCLPLYLFIAGCLMTLLYYFVKAIGLRRIINITLAGFLTLAGIYVIIVSFI